MQINVPYLLRISKLVPDSLRVLSDALHIIIPLKISIKGTLIKRITSTYSTNQDLKYQNMGCSILLLNRSKFLQKSSV